MHDWPSEGTVTIPSPQLVAAWLVLGMLPAERVPLWAAHWLAAGYDGEALAELAGLHGNDPRDVRDLLTPALTECGVTAPDPGDPARGRRQAAAITALDAVARLQVDGLASERWVVDKVNDILSACCHDAAIMGLPLGNLFEVDDEWRYGWGRTDSQLRELVRQACADQLRTGRA